jgi:DNA-binding Lrp family transcriptional regulator
MLRRSGMKAYVVVTTETGKSREICGEIAALPHVVMADACWGGGDVYAVVESDDWKDLNEVVLNQIHRMPGVTRTETHVAIAA